MTPREREDQPDDPPLTPVGRPDPDTDPAANLEEDGEPFEGNHA